jgi:hypothetical protein
MSVFRDLDPQNGPKYPILDLPKGGPKWGKLVVSDGLFWSLWGRLKRGLNKLAKMVSEKLSANRDQISG